MNPIKPVVLVVLDGWGISPITQGNAIAQAKKPFFDYLQTHYPSLSLQASGIAVGLPWGEMGNSETGHLNIGSGLVVYQNLPLISLAIQNGTFFQNQTFLDAITHVKNHSSRLHLVGLFSPGGVHAHTDHMYALIELARRQGLPEVFIHAITDGRDTARDLAMHTVDEFEKKNQDGFAKIATIGGRFYGMDRNENWERTESFYDAMIAGKGPRADSAKRALETSYNEHIYDENVIPTILTANGKDLPRVETNDSVIFFNFRPDRARQLTKAIILPQFAKFDRKKVVTVSFVSMTEYEENLPLKVAFKPQNIENPLARLLSDHGLKQLHVTETEKYAHVTYFFDGGREKPFPNEDFILVPSAPVPSYDAYPQMSAKEITDKVIENIQKETYDFILINYANADMVGHTGSLGAAVKAVECIDAELKRLCEAIQEKNGLLVITADHGNCEEMIDANTSRIDKEHSSNPVPFLFIHKSLASERNLEEVLQTQMVPAGILADVTPTLLQVFSIPQPPEMTGSSLLPIMGISNFPPA